MAIWGVYFGDPNFTSSGIMRTPTYRDYEEFPYGTLEQNTMANSKDPYSKVQEKSLKLQAEKSKKSECPLCKENKKRSLANYMRNRYNHKHQESICEEEDENCS